jgi:hypothetical protein
VITSGPEGWGQRAIEHCGDAPEKFRLLRNDRVVVRQRGHHGIHQPLPRRGLGASEGIEGGVDRSQPSLVSGEKLQAGKPGPCRPVREGGLRSLGMPRTGVSQATEQDCDVTMARPSAAVAA